MTRHTPDILSDLARDRMNWTGPDSHLGRNGHILPSWAWTRRLVGWNLLPRCRSAAGGTSGGPPSWPSPRSAPSATHCGTGNTRPPCDCANARPANIRSPRHAGHIHAGEAAKCRSTRSGASTCDGNSTAGEPRVNPDAAARLNQARNRAADRASREGRDA